MRTFRGSHERLTFDSALYRDIKALGARHGCTLYVTLLAAWQAVLMRLAGQNDLVVGIPLAAQSTLPNGHLVGHCVHMLPLRLEADPSESFARHLVAARTALVEAHEHRDITCGKLIQLLNLPRDAGHAPLAAAVFNVDRMTDTPTFGGLTLERLKPTRSGYNFDVGLDIADTGAELHIECNYDVDLFEAGTIRRWLGYYRNLLTAAIADPSLALNRLPIMPAEERAALLEAGRSSASFEERCLHEAFEAVVTETPDVAAVTLGDESAAYEALNKRANRLAHHLQSLGVSTGMLVGVCLDRSIDMVAAIIGILKAGGAYVPLDPDCPTDRIRTMIDDAGPQVVIASASTLRHFEGSAARVVGLERDRATIDCPARHQSIGDNIARGPGLRHLHVRIDRPAQGRARHPRQRVAAVLGDRSHGSLSAPTMCGRCSTRSPSTSRCGRSGARCSTAAGSSSCRTASAARPTRSTSCCGASTSRFSTRRRRRSGS